MLAGSNLAGQALALLALPFILRLYGPESYGAYSFLVSLAAVLTIAATLKLEVVLPALKFDSLATRLASGLALFIPLATLAIFTASLAITEFASDSSSLSSTPVVFSLSLAAMVLFGSYFLLLRTLLIRLGKFRGVASMQIVRPVLMAGLAVIFALPLSGSGSGAGLVAATVVAGLASVAIGFQAVPLSRRRMLRPFRLRRNLAEILRNRNFLTVTSASQLINQINLQAPILMATLLFGAKEAGWIAIATRITFFPATLIGTSLGAVLNSTVSRRHNQGDPIAREIAEPALFLLVAGIAGYTALYFLVGPLIVPIVGPDWADAAATIRIYCLLGFGYFLISSITFVPVLLRDNRFVIAWNTGRLLSLLAIAVYVYFAGTGYLESVIAICVTGFVFLLIFFLRAVSKARKPR